MTQLARISTAIAVLAALALAAPRPAAADVVAPPPTDCPRGQFGETSHSGPKCVKEAPKDCPAGWRGAPGGVCRLAPCDTDASCKEGEACLEHAVCLAPFVDDYYDYGEEPREKQGRRDPAEGSPLRSRGLLAEPVRPKTQRPKPIVRYNATNVCSREVACGAPATCQREKLCAPRGLRALAYLGTNVEPARVARQTETPLTTSAAEATEVSAPLPAAAPGARGCGACAVGSRDPGGAWVALVTAALALVRRRRRMPR